MAESDADTPPVTGGCLCGAVRYGITAQPVTARICWCRLCQAIGGGSGTVNVVFPSAALSVDGETKIFSTTADSGNVIRRRFCPQCGTPLFSEADVRPNLVVVRAGSLDDPEIAPPELTIWTSAAPSWACIHAALPAYPAGQPPVR